MLARWWQRLRDLRGTKEMQSYILIGMSLVLLVFVSYMTYNTLSKRKIFPTAKHRYDITTLYVGVAEEICGDLARSPYLGSKYEECLRDPKVQDHANDPRWAKMQIPTLDWVMDNYRPKFGGILKKSNERIWREIYKNLKTTIIAVDIPDKYWSLNEHDRDFYRLSFGFTRNALVCVDGRCVYPFTAYGSGSVSNVPIVRSQKNLSTKDSVVMFIRHNEIGNNVSLANGIFLANDKFFSAIESMYPLNHHVDTVAFGLFFFGLFMLTVWQALIWKNYLDYAAFVYLLMSLVVFVTVRNSSFSFSFMFETVKLSNVFDVHMKLFMWVNLCLATLHFAVAYARLKKPLHPIHFLGFLVLMSTLAFSYAWFRGYENVFDSYKEVRAGTGFLLFFLPAGFCFFQSVHLRRILNIDEDRDSKVIAVTRRSNHQIFLGFAFLGFSNSFLVYSIMYYLGYRYTQVFNLGTAFSVIAIAVTVFNPSFLKLRKALSDEFPVTETARMKLLLNQMTFREWAARERQGIFLEFDLAGSSAIAPILQGKLHYIMSMLRQSITDDLTKDGFECVEVKLIGDAILVILRSKNSSLAAEVEKVGTFCRHRLPFYNNRIELVIKRLRGEKNDLDVCPHLHCLVSMVRRYTMASPEETYDLLKDIVGTKRRLSLNLSGLDFLSEELNHIMKYSKKPPSGCITISGHLSDMRDLGIDNDDMVAVSQLIENSVDNERMSESEIANKRKAAKSAARLELFTSFISIGEIQENFAA